MIKIILIAALLFVSGASMAQRVVVGKNGEAIIDNRAMPAGAITTAKKSRTTNGSNSGMGTNDESNLASQESNKTVSHYFEVMKTDGTHAGWHACMQFCENYGDKTWRVPTQRESMLIWILLESLKKVPGYIAPPRANYYAATEFPSNKVTYINFFQGSVGVDPGKSAASFVRCIRDLDPQN